MKNNKSFSENQSIILIREMMEASSKNIKKDGLLIFIWGWIIVLSTFMNFFPEVKLISKALTKTMHLSQIIIGVAGILYTVYHIYRTRKRVKTYIGITARYTWIGIIIVFNLIIIMIKQTTGEINFELNHPIQMTLIGLALFITGGLYREKLLLIGGVIYWIAAYFSKDYALHIQHIFECGAAFLGFVIPGAWLYYQSFRHV